MKRTSMVATSARLASPLGASSVPLRPVMIPAPTAQAMAWAVGAGIITGRSGTELAPKGDASRAEVATMLVRFIALPKQ